jgi:DnaK suppressor protein
MNATVTRTAAKSAVSRSGGKLADKATAVPPKTKTASKSASQSTVKSAKSVKSVPKTTSRNAAVAATATAKPVKATAKTAVQPTTKMASKTAATVAVKVARKAAAQTIAANKVTTAVKSGKVTAVAAKPVKAGTTLKQSPGLASVKSDFNATQSAHMSGDNASAELRDKIQQTVVSKVSEVATKTTKPTPTVVADSAPILTEEQILKMSDKDYMNEAQLAFFKARLQQLEKDLLKNAGETTEHLRETVLVPDPADRATIEEEHALELRTRDRERKLLKKVQQAIASIDAGDYGWCEETGEPIGIPRLLARPTATLSLEAQQRRELKQKLYGD